MSKHRDAIYQISQAVSGNKPSLVVSRNFCESLYISVCHNHTLHVMPYTHHERTTNAPQTHYER